MMRSLFVFLKKYPLFFRFVFWLWTVFIVFMTLKPKIKSSVRLEKIYHLRLDYVIHFGVYFCWMIALGFAYQNFVNSTNKRKQIALLVLILMFSYITEYAQNFSEGRVYNPLDFMFNLIGAILALVLFKWFLYQTRNQY